MRTPDALGTPPTNAEDAVRRLLAAEIPPEIVEVARTLQQRGHAAVLVGGAVRDALLQLPAQDWDLATSATPQEVQTIFPRTLPTGIEHGTITVLVRPAKGHGKSEPVEVTTFRGEGAYEDGRRPSHVVFLRDLHEDLARRDFTVNAFAWDPLAHVFSDPFGGLEDLQAATLRAVGDPAERFREDGLRTIRALRFCATRGMALESATEAAIPLALPVFDQVSRERVWTEFGKLLAADRPSLGLRPMVSSGMWQRLMAPVDPVALGDAIDAVDVLPRDPVLRLARLLRPLAESSSEGASLALLRFEALKPSKQDRLRLAMLLSVPARELVALEDPIAIRRTVARLERPHLADVIRLYEIDDDRARSIWAAIDGVPLSVRELAVGGRELLAEGIASPGPRVGQLLNALLERVWAEPALHDRARLLDLARGL